MKAYSVCAALVLAASVLAQEAQETAASTAPAEYVLQRGDDIEIRAYNLPDLSALVRIRPDGKISLLLLNEVEAAGLTANQLGAALSKQYSTHFRNPRVIVMVKTFANQTVYVGGEVTKPGALPLRSGLTAVQAVMGAGGLKENMAGEKLMVVHGLEKGAPVVDAVDIQQVIERKRPDMVLRPSDLVYVPKSSLNVYIGGEVVRPGMVPLSGEMTILSAVFQAGGFKESAKTDSVVLIRDNGHGGPLATKLKLNDVFTTSAHTKLRPFDVVFVPKSRIASLDKWIDQHVRQLSPMILSFGFSYLFGQKAIATPAF